MTDMKLLALLFCGLALATASPASAEPLPEPIQALLEAAAAQEDSDQFRAAVTLVALTHSREQVAEAAALISPAHGEAALEALGLAPQTPIAAAAPEEVAEPEQAGGWRAAPSALISVVTSGESELWSGQIQLGFRQDSGNSDQLDYLIALEAKRDLALWGFESRLEYAYAEADGSVGRDAFSANAQIDRAIGARWTTYVGGRYDQDALSGFDWTGLVNAGLGYALVDQEARSWRLQAGPALRLVKSPDVDVETEAAVEFTSDVDWRLSERLYFTAETILLASDRSRFEQRLGLQSELGALWALQLGYRYQYEFEPLPGFTEADSRTDVSLIRTF